MERCAGLIENAVFQTLDHAYWEEIGVDGNQILNQKNYYKGNRIEVLQRMWG